MGSNTSVESSPTDVRSVYRLSDLLQGNTSVLSQFSSYPTASYLGWPGDPYYGVSHWPRTLNNSGTIYQVDRVGSDGSQTSSLDLSGYFGSVPFNESSTQIVGWVPYNDLAVGFVVLEESTGSGETHIALYDGNQETLLSHFSSNPWLSLTGYPIAALVTPDRNLLVLTQAAGSAPELRRYDEDGFELSQGFSGVTSADALDQATRMILDRAGTILVGGIRHNEPVIQVLHPDGSLKKELAGDAIGGGQISAVQDLAIDSAGHLNVLRDTVVNGHRVAEWVRVPYFLTD